MIELTLPYPPSVNTYWRTWQGRMIVSKPGRKYRETVVTHCSQLGIKPLHGRLHLAAWVHPPDRRRRDLDNVLKALLDAIKNGGAMEDDSQIDVLEVRRDQVQPGTGFVRVLISEIGPSALHKKTKPLTESQIILDRELGR